MNTIRLCPKCQQPLPPDAPEGLCPACLLSPGSSFANPPAPGPHSYAEPPDSETKELAPGTRLGYVGDYELLEEIARGGMGVVYRARQSSLKRIVAVKMIRSGELAGEAEVKRFRAEAEAAANLKHPHIVAIHEIGEHEGRHYFSMDLVEGKNLAQFTAGKPVTARQAAEWLKAIAEAVQFAHQRGVLHRDLKPQNILVDAEGRPHVTDFGLAKNMQADSGVTQTGAVMGSPSYMAPEQARGRNDLVGPASDVYSLGAVLYELLTGRAPFVAETPLETLRKVVGEEPERPSKLNPDTSPDLETICLKCLEKEPTRRYPTARAMAEDVARFLAGEPVQARPPSPVRKALFWLRQHPWAVTGLFSFAVLGLMGLAYGLAEESAMLRWKLANGAKARFTSDDFFTGTEIGWLAFEFFFFQSLPWISFTRKIAQQELSRIGLLTFALVGLLQMWLGLWVANTGLRHEIWVGGHFGFTWVLWAAVAFSNVWFSSTLLWKCVQYLRNLRPLPTNGMGASVPVTPIMNQPRLLADLLLAEAAVLATIMICFYPVLAHRLAEAKEATASVKDVGAGDYCVVQVLGGLALTWLLISMARANRLKGMKRAFQLIFAFGVLGVILLVLLGSATGFGAKIGSGVLPPLIFTLVIGLGTSWAAIWLKYPEHAESPDLRVTASPLASGQPPNSPPIVNITRSRRLIWLLVAEASVLMTVLWLLYPFLEKASPDKDTSDAAIGCVMLFFWAMAWTLLIITAVSFLKARGIERTVFLPLALLFVSIIGVCLFAIGNHTTPLFAVGLTLVVGVGFGLGAIRLNCVEGGEYPRFMRRWSWRKAAIGTAALTALVALAYAFENWRGRREWARVKADLEAKGEVLDYAAYLKPRVPDEQNVFEHPFMKKYFIRPTTKFIPASQDTEAFSFPPYDSKLLSGHPCLLSDLKMLPRQPNPAESVLALVGGRDNREIIPLLAFTNQPMAEVFNELAQRAGVKLEAATNKAPWVKGPWFTIPNTKETEGRIPRLITARFTNVTALETLSQLTHSLAFTPDREAWNNRQMLVLKTSSQPTLQGILDWYSASQHGAFAQLEEALQRPYSQLTPDARQPDNSPRINFANLRTAAQAYADRCKIHLLMGQPDIALNELGTLRRLADTARATDPPTLVEAMIKVAIVGILADTLKETMADGLWPATHLERVQKLCEGTDLLADFSVGLRGGERAGMLRMLETLAERDLNYFDMFKLSDLVDGKKEHSWGERLLNGVLPSAVVDQAKASYARNMQHSLEGMDVAHQRVDTRAIQAGVKRIESEKIAATRKFHFGAAFGLIVIPNYAKAPITLTKNLTRINEAFVACALERHRAAKGAYPETLAALMPEFAAKLPHDLFDGQPLRYRRTHDGKYLLYSIGWNSTDDGGGIALDKDKQPEWSIDKADWVWNGVPAAGKTAPN